MPRIQMKMAKPSQEDFDAVWKFLQGLESLIERREHPETEERISDWNLQDEMASWIESRWPAVSYSWQRLIIAGQVAIDNACDPTADTLEWKPEIAAAMRAAGMED